MNAGAKRAAAKGTGAKRTGAKGSASKRGGERRSTRRVPAERRIAVFVDIRGFTRLSGSASHAALLPALLYELYVDLDVLAEEHGLHRSGRGVLKPLGDGAMLLLHGAERPSASLQALFGYMRAVERRFRHRMRTANRTRGPGRRLAMALGWGITRGEVVPVREAAARLAPAFASGPVHLAARADGVIDHYGACINRAKRLCDKARPNGVCVDVAAFRKLPEHPGFAFQQRTLKEVRGIAEAYRVWYSRVSI